MNPVKIIVGLVPLVIFSLLGNWLPVNIAAGVGLVAALIIMFTNLKGGVKTVPLIQAIVLAAITILGSLGNHGLTTFLSDYGHGIAPLILGIFIFATLPIRPFTEQYARAAIPREHWDTPEFRSVNRKLSAAWGTVVISIGIFHTLAAILTSAHIVSGVGAFAVNWVVPVIVVIWALDYSKKATTRRSDRPLGTRPEGV